MGETNIHLGMTVGRLRNKVFRALKQRFAENEGVRLTIEEYILLYMVNDPKQEYILQNIALATGKDKSAVMRLVDSLDEKGLMQRVVNPSDRRENYLVITKQGKAVVKEHLDMERQISEDLLQGLSKKQIDVFYQVVNHINKNAHEQ
jgi:MarR family transcriptional regulator, transcriptional regulator for hemolysin